jgi:hypothetical protein
MGIVFLAFVWPFLFPTSKKAIKEFEDEIKSRQARNRVNPGGSV